MSEPVRMDEVKRSADIFRERWAELGVLDGPNGPVLPTTIDVRHSDGTIKSEPIVLQCVTNQQRIKARTYSRKLCEELRLDPKRTADGQDLDFVDELERVCKLAYAIRDAEPPHDQKYPDGKSLWAAVPNERTLASLYQQLDRWELMNDPRPGELSAEELWEVLAMIRKGRDLRPLSLIGGLDQIACITLAVDAAFNSTMTPSRWRSPSTSSSESETRSSASPESEPEQS